MVQKLDPKPVPAQPIDPAVTIKATSPEDVIASASQPIDITTTTTLPAITGVAFTLYTGDDGSRFMSSNAFGGQDVRLTDVAPDDEIAALETLVARVFEYQRAKAAQ